MQYVIMYCWGADCPQMYEPPLTTDHEGDPDSAKVWVVGVFVTLDQHRGSDPLQQEHVSNVVPEVVAEREQPTDRCGEPLWGCCCCSASCGGGGGGGGDDPAGDDHARPGQRPDKDDRALGQQNDLQVPVEHCGRADGQEIQRAKHKCQKDQEQFDTGQKLVQQAHHPAAEAAILDCFRFLWFLLHLLLGWLCVRHDGFPSKSSNVFGHQDM